MGTVDLFGVLLLEKVKGGSARATCYTRRGIEGERVYHPGGCKSKRRLDEMVV